MQSRADPPQCCRAFARSFSSSPSCRRLWLPKLCRDHRARAMLLCWEEEMQFQCSSAPLTGDEHCNHLVAREIFFPLQSKVTSHISSRLVNKFPVIRADESAWQSTGNTLAASKHPGYLCFPDFSSFHFSPVRDAVKRMVTFSCDTFSPL